MDGVLVRFGEIGIKSAPVRRRMLDRLRSNLLALMLQRGVEGDVERRGARLWMMGPDDDALLDVATHTFGVVSASLARRVPATMETMGEAAAALALRSPWQTFAVRASREGEHAYSSQDVGKTVGAAVWRAAEAAGRTPRVDLSAPDFEVFVEVRGELAYVHAGKATGPGGLPIGTQGRVVALVDSDDAVLAAWLLMRRGCDVVAVVTPGVDASLLTAWGLSRAEPGAGLDEATALARRWHAVALVTGDGLDRLRTAPLPVLRPLAGLAAEEVRRWHAVMAT